MDRASQPPKFVALLTADIEARCRKIEAQYALDRTIGGARKTNAKMQVNQALCAGLYELVRSCLHFTTLEDLETRSIQNGHKLPENANPFQLGLAAIFKAKGPKPPRMSAERIWKQAWYAHRHFVPSEFLEGFLRQCRATGIQERALSPYIEPGFDQWVIEHLAAATAGHACDFGDDDFPHHIRTAASEIAQQLEEEKFRESQAAFEDNRDDDCWDR